MRGKLVLLVGVGIGYVLGARAGRERYEQIKRAAKRFWSDPRVTQQVHNVEQFAKDKAPEVVDFIGDTAKKVITRSPKSPSTKAKTTKSNAASSSASSATKPKNTKPTSSSTKK